jgi:uncharacterized protein YpmB
MNKFNNLFIATVLFSSIGCANHVQPRQPEQQYRQSQQQSVKFTERAIKVEKNSISDYAVRAGHTSVKAAQGTAEAMEDAYDWVAEKKKRAKAWLHEVTAE